MSEGDLTPGDTPDDVERRVLDHLDQLGAAYQVLRIDPAHAATADFCAHYGWPPEATANCLLVAGRDDPDTAAACLVAATAHVDVNRTVRRWLGVRKASFVAADDVAARTGMTPHGVTPFSLPDGLPVLVDAALTDLAEIVVGGGSRALKLVVAPSTVTALPHAHVVDGLSREPPPST